MSKHPLQNPKHMVVQRQWFHDFTDAELGAALRVVLADPNFVQYAATAGAA